MPSDQVPARELTSRQERCKELLRRFIPQARGILLFSRLNIYYFSGSLASGALWLPVEGAPVLFCRRGAERAQIESSLAHIYAISRSWKLTSPMGIR